MTQRHDPGLAPDAMVSQVMQWAHEPPCKHVYAIFVAASAVCVLATILCAVTGFTVSRILSGYDSRLEALAKVDLERTATIARIEQTLVTQQKTLDEQHVELKAMNSALQDVNRMLQQYRNGTP